MNSNILKTVNHNIVLQTGQDLAVFLDHIATCSYMEIIFDFYCRASSIYI